MQTAALYETRRFRLEDQPAPGKPGPGEVQVAVKAVGICGSDLHYFAEGAIGDTPCVYPMVLGHEPSGVVIETGAGVSGWAVGDAAVLEPALYCYHCEFCMSGRHNVCADMKFLSSPGEPGFFRERVNLPAHNLLALPKNVGLREGSLVEPLSIILHSMVFAQPRMGETAAVFGAGPIGLLTVAVLKLSGVRRIWVVEPVAERLFNLRLSLARFGVSVRLGRESARDRVGGPRPWEPDACGRLRLQRRGLSGRSKRLRHAG